MSSFKMKSKHKIYFKNNRKTVYDMQAIQLIFR